MYIGGINTSPSIPIENAPSTDNCYVENGWHGTSGGGQIETSEEVFEVIDCLKCAKCCKTTSPIFRDVDIKRISKKQRMKEVDYPSSIA